MHSRLGLNDCSLGDGSIRLDMSAYQVGMAVNNSIIGKSGSHAALSRRSPACGHRRIVESPKKG